MMWAILGEIEFEVIASPSAAEQSFSASFAEHARIAGKPLLEAAGGELEEIRWTILLHERLHEVGARLRAIREVVSQQAPLALVMGDGTYLGPWVIAEGAVTTRKTDARGRVVSAEVQITLREYTGEFTAPAPRPGLEGETVEQPGLVTRIEEALTDVQQLARAARTAENVMRSLDQTLQWARGLSPLAAIAQIPAVLGSLGQAAQSVSVLHALGASAGSFASLAQLGANLVADVQAVHTTLIVVQPENVLQTVQAASQITQQSLQQFGEARAALLALTSDVAMRKS